MGWGWGREGGRLGDGCVRGGAQCNLWLLVGCTEGWSIMQMTVQSRVGQHLGLSKLHCLDSLCPTQRWRGSSTQTSRCTAD